MRNIQYKYTIITMLAILIPLDIYLWFQYSKENIVTNLTYALCVAIFIVIIIVYFLVTQFYKRNGEKINATIIKTYFSYFDAYKEVYGVRRRLRKISDPDDIYAVVEYSYNGQKVKNLLYIPHPHSINYFNAKNVSIPIVVYKNKCVFDDDTFALNKKKNKENDLKQNQINEAVQNSSLMKNEIDSIYEQVGDKYNLTLNQVVIKSNGEPKVEKTISYKNGSGSIKLFKLDEFIVFVATFTDGQKDELKLRDIEQAIKAINKFMNNERDFNL